MFQHITMARGYLINYLVIVTFLCTTEVPAIPLRSSNKTVKFELKDNNHDDQSDLVFRFPHDLNESIFRNSTSPNNFVYSSSENNYLNAGILHDDILRVHRTVSVKSCPRNRTLSIWWTQYTRKKTPVNESRRSPDDKGDPRLPISLRSRGNLPCYFICQFWRHMFSHLFHLFNGTGQCQSASHLYKHWPSIANLYRYLSSRISQYGSSYFRESRRCILGRLDGGELLKIFLYTVVVLAGLRKLGAWSKSPTRASRGRFGLEVDVSYGRRNPNSQPTMKSWRYSTTSLLEPLRFLFIRPWQLKSHPGFQEDNKNEPSAKADDWRDNGSDADGSSYLKQFYTSTAGWQAFRPERAQVRVAPIQKNAFLPNPTLNPDIDLAYIGYRIATLGALPASFPVSLFRLAEAGFYFRGQGDEMTCYSCGSRYSGWTSGDDPMAVHRRLAPRCRHVIATDSETQSLAGGAAAHAPVEDGPGDRQDWTGRLTTQPAASGTGRQGVSTPGASLNGHNGGRETETARPNTISSGASLNGHIGNTTTETARSSSAISGASVNGHISSSISQPAGNSGPSSASQPASRGNGTNAFSRPIATMTVPDSSTLPFSDGASETPLFPRANLDLGQAVYPMYQDSASRRRSFEQCRWDDSRAPPLDEVIMSGMFYAGYADCVRCFYCGVGLKHWLASDDVWKEHVRWRPHCGYLRTIRTEAFIRDMQRQLNAAGSGETQDTARPGSASSPGRSSTSTATTPAATTATATASTPATTSSSQTRQPAATAASLQTQRRSGTPEPATTRRSAQTSTSASGTFSPDSQTARTRASLPPTSSASAAVPQTQEPSALSPSSSVTTTTTASSDTTTTTTTTANSAATTSGAGPASEPATPGGGSAGSSSTAADGDEGSGRAVTPAGGAGGSSSSSEGSGGAGDGSHGNNQRDANGEEAAADAANDVEERRERLQEENRRQSERLLCRVCRQSRVGAILLPCGHVVACEPCAQTLASCLLCGATIRATARVFLN